ncbi:MAG: alpha/beta fold hydrolase [Actinomadura sp.]
MPMCELDGTSLAYDDVGDGPAVVLLHAGIADRRMWTPLLERLADRHRVVAYDLRGYGESARPTASFAHHDDVVGLLDRLGVDEAALVGCSSGGAVAIDAALAHPDRVAGLALLGSAVSGHRWSESDELWDQVVGDVDETDLDAVAAAEVRFWVVGPDRRPQDVDAGLIAFAETMNRRALAAEATIEQVGVRELRPPAVQRLGEVSAPTLVTAGAADVPELRRLADRLAAEIPYGRRLADVPDSGHLLPLERPEPVAIALLDFFAEIASH